MIDRNWFDERITDPLVQHDRECAEGVVATSTSSVQVPPDEILSDEDREHLEKAIACIDLLHAIKPSRRTDDADRREEQRSPASAGPRFIGRFQVGDELGSGGFGIVYKAWDAVTERDVALKIPRIEAIASTDLRGRFEQEARAAARLDHPHIATVLDAGVDGVIPYIATIYYPGITLAAWLKQRHAPLDGPSAARILLQLSEAIAHAHERGVLHRDIKPSNVLIVDTEGADLDATMPANVHLKLMDFGLAKLTAEARDWTKTGTLLGTVRYMAPEQAAGRAKDTGPPTDVYALGAVLYELLTGAPPFASESDLEILRQLEVIEPTKLRKIDSTISRDLETICAKCLEKEPGRRYQSATALSEDLTRYLQGKPILARSATAVERSIKWARRNPVWAALIALAVASTTVVLCGLLWFNLQLSRERDHARESERRALESERLATRREREALNHAYSFDIRQAEDALSSNQPEQASKWLARHLPRPGAPDLRDFAWWLLHRQLAQSQQILATHGGRVVMAAHPREPWVATAGVDGFVRIWNLETRAQITEFKAHVGGVSSLAFLPDGAKLVSGGSDFIVKIWKFPEAKLLRSVPSGIGSAPTVAISQDGKLIALTASDKSIRLWDVEQDKAAGSLKGHKDVIKTMVFDSRGTLFSASEDAEVRAWNIAGLNKDSRVANGLLVRSPDRGDHIVYALALDASGNYLIGAMWDGGFERWSLSPDRFGVLERSHLAGPSMPRCIIADGPDIFCVGLSAGTAQFIRVTSDREQELLAVRHGATGRINSLATVANSQWIAIGSANGTASRVAKPLYIGGDQPSAGELPRTLDWNEELLASAFNDRVIVTNLTSRSTVWERRFYQPLQVRVAPRSQKILINKNDPDGTGELLSAWNLSDRAEPLWQIKLTLRSITIDLGESEQTFAAADGQIAIVGDMQTGQIRWKLPHPKEVSRVKFIDDTHVLVTAGNDGNLRFWDVTTGKLIETKKVHTSAAHNLSVSIGGKRILTSGDGKFSVWDRTTWTELATFPARESVDNAFLLGDGETLAVQYASGLTIWRVADGSEVMDMRGDLPIDLMARSVDGHAIAIQSSIAVDFLDGHPDPSATQ